ncbi:hypothetical protein SNEBB_004723 [Seison nebaliae]|nr:hypothetical protein SNEBB_004723 [Seison nebaliae]
MTNNCKNCERLVNEILRNEKSDDIKGASLKELKEVCRKNDEAVIDVYNLLRRYLSIKCDNLKGVELVKYFFQSSHIFRHLFIENVNEFLLMITGYDVNNPGNTPQQDNGEVKDKFLTFLYEIEKIYGKLYGLRLYHIINFLNVQTENNEIKKRKKMEETTVLDQLINEREENRIQILKCQYSKKICLLENEIFFSIQTIKKLLGKREINLISSNSSIGNVLDNSPKLSQISTAIPSLIQRINKESEDQIMDILMVNENETDPELFFNEYSDDEFDEQFDDDEEEDEENDEMDILVGDEEFKNLRKTIPDFEDLFKKKPIENCEEKIEDDRKEKVQKMIVSELQTMLRVHLKKNGLLLKEIRQQKNLVFKEELVRSIQLKDCLLQFVRSVRESSTEIDKEVKILSIKILHSSSAQRDEVKIEKEIPIISYGIDLEHWEDTSKIRMEPALLSGPIGTSIHGNWTRERDELFCDESSNKLIELLNGKMSMRLIDYKTEWKKIEHRCYAMRNNGLLCLRQDREKCPFHGIIIPRDIQGLPLYEEDVSDMDVSQPKKFRADGIDFHSEKMEQLYDSIPDWQDEEHLREIYENTGMDLTIRTKVKRKETNCQPNNKNDKSIRKNNKSLKSRLTDKRTLNRIGKKIDEIEDRLRQDKFRNNFQYHLKK